MQAQDAGFVRILCVASEGAYETLHEPPTEDPHGGWCGGRELETPGYPIGPQLDLWELGLGGTAYRFAEPTASCHRSKAVFNLLTAT